MRPLAPSSAPLTRRSWLLATAGLADPLLRPRHTFGATLPPTVLTIGTQPLGVPSGVISAVMQRDAVLARQLAGHNLRWQPRPYRRGADMLEALRQGQLAAALLGDLPTLMACTSGAMVAAGLLKQASTAVVSRDIRHLRELIGRRIAYVPASSAHLTLLQGLDLAQLSPRQVHLIHLPVDQMPEALARREIHAFAAWEPITTAALARDPANRVVFRGLTTDYWVMPRHFVDTHPEATQLLLAGLLRGIHWMRHSASHLEQAVVWASQDSQTAFGQPLPLPVDQLARITLRDLLDIPSAPVIAQRHQHPPLNREFGFLTRLGQLPANARWEDVKTAFANDLLVQVLARPAAFQLRRFEYASSTLPHPGR